MLFDRKSANHAPSVQALMVVPHFAHVVPLLVGKIPFDKQLPGKEVIARMRRDITFRAKQISGAIF
jgi:hypothetical protein